MRKRRYIPHANPPAGPRPLSAAMRVQMEVMTDEELAKTRIRTFWIRCWHCNRVEWLRYFAPCADLDLIKRAKIEAGWTGEPVPNHPDQINFLRPKCPTCTAEENFV